MGNQLLRWSNWGPFPSLPPQLLSRRVIGFGPTVEATICQLTCRWRPPRSPDSRFSPAPQHHDEPLKTKTAVKGPQSPGVCRGI
ncbi:hypothetical protein FQN60_012517 [Etheostoma spectabile]|uniref:Uncharacterized protein n=1 Tax=Etheostoma spectabile TaxID=54343 RepID=A0A5J5DQ36_9PERO|nr:hypothetical protein FQN60_012517 [Etheostoma spectabile]